MKNIYANTAVIILAGGQSQRAETIKGLRQIGRHYWIDLQIQFFKNLGIKKIFVGLGFDYQEYLDKSIEIKNTNYYINSKPENGPFSTLQMLLKNSINSNYQKLILIHIDHAIPKRSTINKLVSINNYDVVKPTYTSKSGHPIVLSHDFCRQLIRQPYSSQLNIEIKKLSLERIKWVRVDDSSILANLNTQQQWLCYIENQDG